ncbi:uncharacterized protein LOC122994022 [Thunnus albacares]|uniref:uncharacterized protein LOC122994022 n=1 Tax=Thunnus albacares TaxID=8236 RepID=UPI001CF6BB5F|nr:uncharacterized protein LOC122994022 [Thunnus albacares]
MAPAVLLVAVCMLYLRETQGSSDVTTVFVQKGKDLRLDVKKPVVLGRRDEFRWQYNNSHNIVRLFSDNETEIIPSYVGRAEVSLQSHSLLLKNVQQNDSGDYTALITRDKDQRLAEYEVIIQDLVSPVQLSVDSVSNSTESCNLTVSCSTERSHISSTFGCDTQTCYQKGGEQSEVTSSGSSLRVYLLNDSIICNHSNQVNWKEDLKKIRTLCPLNTDPVSPVNLSVDSVSNSTESCNLTVSCSTECSHISSTFGCDNQTCYQKGGEQSEVTTSGSTLHVYLLNDSIICNHSNQVSWKEDLKKIRTLCPLNTDPVSPVQLSVDSVSNSIESCNLTVSCSTERSHISSTFECNNQTCHQKGGEQSEVTSSDSSLRVYLLSDSIFCNHSNQVSWTKDLKKIWLLCSSTAGSTAVTPVFVKQGDDVLLEVKKPVVLTEGEDFFWIFNTSYSVVRLSHDNKIIIFKKYSGRAELSDQNGSLLLKNLQQADSGPYVAQVIGAKDRKLAEYKVIVQNPVSPVNLSVDSVSNSTESCNLTVSCRTEHSHISSTFRCDTQTCYQKGGEQSKVTSFGSSLCVYLLNDSIICNHSNQVSWTKDLKEIWDFCPLNTATNGSLTIGSWIGIVFGCLVVIFCICFGLFKGITINQQKRKKTCENTIYAVPQGIEAAQPLNQNATEDASGCTTYSTVGISTRPTRSTESNNINLPEIIYSQFNIAQLSNHHPELKNTDKIHSQD